MSTKQTNLNEDIKKLINEGYTVSIENNCLIVQDIPYIDQSGVVHEDGVLFDSYPFSGGHTFMFSDIPHTTEGKEFHVAGRVAEWNGFPVKTQLSFKKTDGKSIIDYVSHFDKVTYYAQILTSQARSINPNTNPRKYKPDNISCNDSPFCYGDLNSSRAGINHINKKLENQKIAIVGLGGTGSYLLDLVSKSHVSEIHIYDDDKLHTHNAFRAPGAIKKSFLENPLTKIQYFYKTYSNFREGIKKHEYRVTPDIINSKFINYDFVFLCIDSNDLKKEIIEKLIEIKIPFIDCGISVTEEAGSLLGSIRLTTVTSDKNDHVKKRINLKNGGEDIYDSNIQIAELNALNATLAVIKWKKVFGFYHNQINEHDSTYMLNCNSLSNDEIN